MSEQYTQEWHHEVDKWKEILAPFASRMVEALEIGCFEGRSAIWLLRNILTHQDSHLSCVDPYSYSDADPSSAAEKQYFESHIDLQAAKRLFYLNTEPWRKSGRCTHIPCTSLDYFRIKSPGRKFDIIHIDGAHTPFLALTDLVLAWHSLKDNGILILDDLGWEGWEDFKSRGPLIAYRALLSCVNNYRVLHQGYVGFIQRATA